MKTILLAMITLLVTCNTSATSIVQTNVTDLTKDTQCLSFMKHKVKKLNEEKVIDLCKLTSGKPMLIVNTASLCNYTPQFKTLEALHQQYKDQGLVVIAFPSNDFFQEESDERKIAKNSIVDYGVTFTMLSPLHVWGRNAHPIFKKLAEHTTGPKWNFYKYLISADGQTIKHFNSRVTPDSDIFISAVNNIL